MDKLKIPPLSQKKVLITGGSGWLGKAAVNTLTMSLGFSLDEIMLVSRVPKKIRIGEQVLNSTSWAEIYTTANLRPEYFLPFAFSTREQLGSFGAETYIAMNNTLIRRHSEIIENLQPANVINVSSGAAQDLSKIFNGDEENIYGKLKFAEEESIKKSCNFAGSNLITARLWNCSGFGISKINTFALGNFISSVLDKKNIVINSKRTVFRRYVDISEFLLLCLHSVKRERYQYLESGGELIELRNLAEVVVRLLDPNTTIDAPEISRELPSNDYFSTSDGYERLLWSNFGRLPITLNDQVIETANYIRTQLSGGHLYE
jgi:nucleoside-diphosphate-sugar epimerase